MLREEVFNLFRIIIFIQIIDHKRVLSDMCIKLVFGYILIFATPEIALKIKEKNHQMLHYNMYYVNNHDYL